MSALYIWQCGPLMGKFHHKDTDLTSSTETGYRFWSIRPDVLCLDLEDLMSKTSVHSLQEQQCDHYAIPVSKFFPWFYKCCIHDESRSFIKRIVDDERRDAIGNLLLNIETVANIMGLEELLTDKAVNPIN
ncbi:hypothetical protein N7504_003588 [Penicillium tannophilum]|nr:hypothetical protein N7504_003588 [Penicillium tannophilum]